MVATRELPPDGRRTRFVRLVDVPFEVRMKAARSLARDRDANRIFELAVSPPADLGAWVCPSWDVKAAA